MRYLLGKIATTALELLGRLPTATSHALGTILLPLYVPFRVRTRAKLRRLDPPVPPFTYYRMRLRLALLSVKHATARDDGCAVTVEGAEVFAAALTSGKPVLLLGWHQGPVELLHRIPAQAAPGRVFRVMTASAFSPVLADWMARGRRRHGIAVVRPYETVVLRAWARGKGVLAVMTDQVPGEPEEWTTLEGGVGGGTGSAVGIPWPGRLISWAAARNPEILAVSARLENGNRVVFRYDRVTSKALETREAREAQEEVKESVGKLLAEALARAPEQYNWSYPKIRME